MGQSSQVTGAAGQVSPGRAAYLEAQRSRTRAAIVAGGRDVFAGTPYLRATVDDILVAASISRATFYQHFESKTALAFAIYEEMRPEVQALFDRIGDVDPRSHDAVVIWVRDYVALYERHRYVTSLLAQLQLFEPTFRDRLKQDRDNFIARLSAAGAGGFTGTTGDDESAIIRRTRARLMLARLTFVAAEVAQAASLPPAEAQAYLHVAADDLGAFLSSST